MAISLPYSRNRRYLTGIDWAIHALDAITKRETGHGHASQIVLVLKGRLEPPSFRRLLRRMLDEHPVLSGYTSRDWNLCPFWKMGEPRPAGLPFTTEERTDDRWTEMFPAFESHVNRPFPSPRHHLHFHLVRSGHERSYLGMSFDHRLLDAFGAETFLELMHRTYAGTEAEAVKRIKLVEKAHLDRWLRRFLGGRTANRLQIRLSRGGLAALPMPRKDPPLNTRFDFAEFSGDETQRVLDIAAEESGPFMLLPSLLARIVHSLHRVAKRRGRVRGCYVVPVSVVNRSPQNLWEKLFFNHMSFLIFQTPADIADDVPELVAHIRGDLYDQMQTGVPEDLYHASILTRIAPLEVMRQLARIPMGGSAGSCYFAFLRESGYRLTEFMGLEVENLIHTPHVPPPPGVGVFLNAFQGRLNLVLSHLEGILSPEEAASLTSSMREQFLTENSVEPTSA